MKEFLVLGIGAIFANLLLIWFLIKVGNPGKAKILNNNYGFAGDNSGAGDAGKGSEGSKPEPKFTQDDVNRVVQERLAREREKYSDYDTLRQKVSEFERTNSEKAQRELEEQKKYDEAKKGLEGKLTEREKALQIKDQEISDLKISNSLTNEINRQNAFAEETLALLKSNAVLNKDGQVRIKGKDSNGVDIDYSVEEGIKRFLETRPHLVKSNFKSGSGGKGGDGAGNGNVGAGGADDINTLNADLAKALNSGNRKMANEIKTKINSHYASRGVSLR